MLIKAQYGERAPRVEYANVPWLIGHLVGHGVDLIDLRTRYTVEDAYNQLEIIQVTEYNRHAHSN